MSRSRFSVSFELHGAIEVLLPPRATEEQIERAAKKAIQEELAYKGSALFSDLAIVSHDGPY